MRVLLMLMRDHGATAGRYRGDPIVTAECWSRDGSWETVLKAGRELAEPGEFTKTGVLKRQDRPLSQAEAVIDVINAKNEYALQSLW